MKRAFLTAVAFLGVLAFLALFIADREFQAGIERLSRYRFSPRSALDTDPGVNLASGHSRSSLPSHADNSRPEQKGRREYVRRPTGLKIDWNGNGAQPRSPAD
jgi:hypothetical protein